ncbi:Clavaminate synthase-like protein [Mycena sanguinolenta]|nr:Clavaminate synthase-like protein [Mycena sanguinolenta]
MSSPVVHHGPMSMPINRLLNSRSPSPPTFSPPRVQPQNTRRMPPIPQVNKAYVDPRVAETGYSLAAVDDSWRPEPSSSSNRYPAPMRANSTNFFPPNRNLQLVPQKINSSIYALVSADTEERTARQRPYSNVSHESASVSSHPRKRTAASVPHESATPMDTALYSGEPGGSTFHRFRLGLVSGEYTAHETPQPGSPELDASQYQTAERASVRLVARDGSPRENSPAYSNQFSQQLKKRDVLEVEDAEQQPPPKKRKPKEPKAASGTNKRSGTAKKRGEQIPANSDQLPTTMYAMVKPTGNSRDDGGAHRVIPVKISNATNLFREDQTSRCMSKGYKTDESPKCVSCIRRWAGDTCRFQNLRSFFRDNHGNLVGISFTEKQEDEKMPKLEYPDNWNIPIDRNHLHQTKKIIAAALLPILQEELEHLSLDLVIYRPRENEVRATCDTCLTSIFCCSWMCRCCGREACPECFQLVKALTIAPTGASQSALKELQDRKDLLMHTSPFFLNCLKRNEHGAKDFSPMTRFSKPELEKAIQDMEQLLRDEGLPVPGHSTEPVSTTASTSQGSHSYAPPQDIAASPSTDSEATLVPTPNGDAVHLSAESSRIVNSEEIPSHAILRFTDSELTDEVFRPLWAKGDPLLVTDAGKKLKIHWSPEYFIEKYGQANCLIIECQTEQNKLTTVGEFFRTFGQYEGRDKCWKLKDWPPEKDFKSDFPELYEDFNQAVPIPHYVRRDGVLNIASHFPTNTIGPDLGPKMYNANANRETFGNKGSTRLHMDMADALNLMTYAAPDADGKEGCAAWDLFRAQDSDKIRQFMRAKFALTSSDPIHMQQIYLEDDARRQLWEEYGVKSYRVYQKAGEAVFIPAGCAHQVRNLSDCIKVAIDFVSPENIERCEKLTREFREVNQSKAWKEDVLQLRTMMWFAWLSCCRQESVGA